MSEPGGEELEDGEICEETEEQENMGRRVRKGSGEYYVRERKRARTDDENHPKSSTGRSRQHQRFLNRARARGRNAERHTSSSLHARRRSKSNSRPGRSIDGRSGDRRRRSFDREYLPLGEGGHSSRHNRSNSMDKNVSMGSISSRSSIYSGRRSCSRSTTASYSGSKRHTISPRNYGHGDSRLARIFGDGSTGSRRRTPDPESTDDDEVEIESYEVSRAKVSPSTSKGGSEKSVSMSSPNQNPGPSSTAQSVANDVAVDKEILEDIVSDEDSIISVEVIENSAPAVEIITLDSADTSDDDDLIEVSSPVPKLVSSASTTDCELPETQNETGPERNGELNLNTSIISGISNVSSCGLDSISTEKSSDWRSTPIVGLTNSNLVLTGENCAKESRLASLGDTRANSTAAGDRMDNIVDGDEKNNRDSSDDDDDLETLRLRTDLLFSLLAKHDQGAKSSNVGATSVDEPAKSAPVSTSTPSKRSGRKTAADFFNTPEDNSPRITSAQTHSIVVASLPSPRERLPGPAISIFSPGGRTVFRDAQQKTTKITIHNDKSIRSSSQTELVENEIEATLREVLISQQRNREMRKINDHLDTSSQSDSLENTSLDNISVDESDRSHFENLARATSSSESFENIVTVPLSGRPSSPGFTRSVIFYDSLASIPRNPAIVHTIRTVTEKPIHALSPLPPRPPPPDIRSLPKNDLRKKLLRNASIRKSTTVKTVQVVPPPPPPPPPPAAEASENCTQFPEFGVVDTDWRRPLTPFEDIINDDLTICRTVTFDPLSTTTLTTATTWTEPITVTINNPNEGDANRNSPSTGIESILSKAGSTTTTTTTVNTAPVTTAKVPKEGYTRKKRETSAADAKLAAYLTKKIEESRDQLSLCSKEKELLQSRQELFNGYRGIQQKLQQNVRLVNLDKNLESQILDLQKKLEEAKRKQQIVRTKAAGINQLIKEKCRNLILAKSKCQILSREVKRLGERVIGENKYKVTDLFAKEIMDVIKSLETMSAKQPPAIQLERGAVFRQLLVSLEFFPDVFAPNLSAAGDEGSEVPGPSSSLAGSNTRSQTSSVESSPIVSKTTLNQASSVTSVCGRCQSEIEKERPKTSPRDSEWARKGCLTKHATSDTSHYERMKVVEDETQQEAPPPTVSTPGSFVLGENQKPAQPSNCMRIEIPLDLGVESNCDSGSRVRLDPMKQLCPEGLLRGTCAEEDCPFQHI